MIVIADTSPLRYLAVLGELDILRSLYGRIVLPSAVYSELSTQQSPAQVRDWLSTAPAWIDIAPAPQTLPPNKEDLDPGEFEAIQLALKRKPSLLLIDEAKGRAVALQLGIELIGTVGLIEKAARANLLDFFEVLARLEKTNFRLGPAHRQVVVDRHLAYLKKSPVKPNE